MDPGESTRALRMHVTLYLQQAFRERMHIWLERVPSAENIADLPSRESCGLLESMRAQWRAPRVASLFAEESLEDVERAVTQVVADAARATAA